MASLMAMKAVSVITITDVQKQQCHSVGRSDPSVMEDKTGNPSKIPVITESNVQKEQCHSVGPT
jgi:hypothetical protein